MLSVPSSYLSPPGRIVAEAAERAQLAATPLVLDGVDPVALLEGHRALGSFRLERTYDGLRYRFSSERTRAIFEQDPEHYRVTNVAICPVTGQRVDRDIFRVVSGRIYLFCCAEAQVAPESVLARFVGSASS